MPQLTATISSGGTYTGAFNGDVSIATTQPVIVDGAVGDIRFFDGVDGVNLEVRNCKITGVDAWSSPRWITLDGSWQRIDVHHNEIRNTRGIYVGPNHKAVRPLFRVTRNKHTNIKGTTQGASLGEVGNFVQFAVVWGGPTYDPPVNPNWSLLEVSWNLIVNEHNASNPEDVVSVFKTAHVRILNNVIFGQTKPDSMSGSSQNSITFDWGSDEQALVFDNIAQGNYVIDAYSIGSGGHDNQLLDNVIVSDGYMGDTGRKMTNGYQGIYLRANAGVARGNKVGYIGSQGRVDGNVDWAQNAKLPDPTRQTEKDYLAKWMQLATAGGATVGVGGGAAPVSDDIADGLDEIRRSAYVSGHTKKSYIDANPQEAARVFSYLDGGAEPAPFPATLIGSGLTKVERGRRPGSNPPPDPTYLFQDEFSGTTLDTSKWWATPWCSSAPDDAQGCYNAANAYVENGNLVLKVSAGTMGRPYDFARVQTFSEVSGWPANPILAKFDPPVHIEARIKFSGTAGYWGGFWTMGPAGDLELDIQEFRGAHPNEVAVHTHISTEYGSAKTVPFDGSQGFHVYWADYTVGHVKFGVDDIVTGETDLMKSPPAMIRLSNQIGVPGTWGGEGGPPPASNVPGLMLVDYVRVWRI